MAHDVFLSYSAADKPIADAVCAGLEGRGIRCWMAPRDILPGLDWGAAIIDAINEAKAMVLVFSSNANASKQIKREVERAVNKGLTIVPLRVEDVPLGKTLEYFISTPHWLDAISPPLERHIDRLADTVQALLARPSRSTDAGVPLSAAPPRAGSARAATAPAYSAAPFPATAPLPAPAPAARSGRRGLWIAVAVAAVVIVAVIVSALGRSHPPQILSVQFPAAVYAGQRGTGKIFFRDKKGDVANARFDVVQSTTFQPFSFAVTGVAGKTAGEIAFWLTCPVPQHIVLQAVLTDAAGKQSNPVPFAFDIQPPPQVVHPLPPRPKRPGRDFTVEAPNGVRFKIPR